MRSCNPAPPEKVETSSEATESDGEEEAPQSKKHKAKAEKKEETDSDEDKPLGLRRNMADSPGGEVTPSLLFPNLKIADKDDKWYSKSIFGRKQQRPTMPQKGLWAQTRSWIGNQQLIY